MATRSATAQQKVRDTAGELLFEAGISGFTVDEIARRSGVAKTTIYRHWPSVHALLVDTVACQIEGFSTPDTGSLYNDLRALFGNVVPLSDMVGRRRMMLGLLYAATDDPPLHDALSNLMLQRTEPLRNVLVRARQRGELRADIGIDDAVDAVEGPMISRFMLRGEPFSDQALDALLDIVAAGLTRTSSSAV